MLKIIIVDDEDFALDGLEKLFLKIPECKVVLKCADGCEAIQYLKSHTADAIFSDIRMKNVSGLELNRWVSENKKSCKVILVSAYSEFSYAQEAIACGVFGYLLKPIRLGAIKEMTDRLKVEKEYSQSKDIWKRDLKRELIELEMYHTITTHSDSVEKKLNKRILYSEYQIVLHDCPESSADDPELIRTGLINIFRWCGTSCVPVITNKSEREYVFVLLSDYRDSFPAIEDLEDHIRRLMKISAIVSVSKLGDITEFQQKINRQIAQDDEEDALIKDVKRYIDMHLKDNLSREDVANYVHLDPSYFSKYFKKKSGGKFSDYLSNRRLELVLKLLDRGYKVYDAAQEAGFRNRNYFNTVFKRQTGMSPTQYKHQQGKKGVK